jgi:hypothetical protein
MLIGKQISGLFLLFSSKRVCCHCGAHHNTDLNLSGTESECVIRLWAIDTRKFFHTYTEKTAYL